MISDINIRVDRDRCYACGICVERCIMDNLRLSVPPCRQACPLHMNAQGYIRLFAMGRQEEAVGEMAPYLPFINILGRICHHPCESACERRTLGGPVCIRALKRYLGERFSNLCMKVPVTAPLSGKRAVVVGSGPAGLMAAYHLCCQGHRVTVLEKESEPGGHLRYSIPDFRLPVAEVTRTVSLLQEMGIIFRTGTALGHDIELGRLESEFDAVMLALGCRETVGGDFPGCSPELLTDALSLLREVKEGKRPRLGKTVLVLGGGNAAVDTALTCRRLGVPDVRIVCLEKDSEMPAFAWSLDQARDEGILFENGWSPLQLNRLNDKSLQMEFSRCLSVYTPEGAFAPKVERSCGLKLNADAVFVAFGLKPGARDIPQDLLCSETGRWAVESQILSFPGRPGVFACGDCFSGSTTVVEAMASGEEAAVSANRYLRGEGLRWGRGFWDGARVSHFESGPDRAPGFSRPPLPRLPLMRRQLGLEDESTFSEKEALGEAQRCLSCGRSFEMNKTCWYCLPCEIECPVNALKVRIPYLVR